MYIAHTDENNKDRMQSIKEHSINTAEIASSFAIEPLKDLVYNIGLLHDIGKYREKFQEKIKTGKNLKVEHSGEGAKESYNPEGVIII